MSEANYYENSSLWTKDAYLKNQEQLNRFGICQSILPKNISEILDVGTGNGAFLAYLEQNYLGNQIRLMGLERSQAAIRASICQSKIIHASADKIPYNDQSFELVSALEVIEHLPYQTYEKTLREIERISKKYILISVPYRENRVLVKCPYCGCLFQPNYHMRRFNESKMRDLFDLFELTTTKLVTIKKQVSLITWPDSLKKDLAIIKTGFPEKALCPQCGFKKNTNEKSEKNTKKTDIKQEKRSIKEIMKDILPKKYKSINNWIVCLYTKKSFLVSR